MSAIAGVVPRACLGVLLLAALAVSGCVETRVMRGGIAIPIDQAIDADLKSARRDLAAGRTAEARRTLEAFLDELGSSSRSNEARFLLAGIYRDVGELEQAAQLWRRVAEREPLSRRGAESRLRAAEVYRDLGDPEVALRLLRSGDVRRLPDELQATYHRTAADVARLAGEFSSAVIALAYARAAETSEQEQGQIDLEVAELIEERLRDEELEATLPRLPSGRVYLRTAFELARRQIARGDAQLARQTLAGLPEDLDQFDRAIVLGLLDRAERATQFDTFPLGIQVPLSGRYSSFGRSVLRGITLGLGLFDPQQPGRYRLLVRDTRGEPQQAIAATRELAQSGARLIFGPMRSVEAAASAPVAQSSRVPLLSLAVRPDLPYQGSYVFRMGVTASAQVDALVGFAMGALEAQRFAILYPRDDYGRGFKNLFWDEVERRGGRIVGVESYEPGAVDIQTEVKKLVGLQYLTDSERQRIRRRDRLERRREENEAELRTPELSNLPPYVDFDALFIPDAAAQVGVVLPQLRFYDVADVTLLGPSEWNDPVLLELAANEAEGAVFVDTFDPRSEDPNVQDFIARYFAAYGEAPDAYAAEAFDAAVLLTRLVERGARSPDDLARTLMTFPDDLPDYRGVAGLVGFDEVGGSQRELSLLTVRRRRIQAYVPGAPVARRR